MDTKKVVKKKIAKKHALPDTVPPSSHKIDNVEKLKDILTTSTVPSFEIDKSPSTWVMPNRVKFNNWLDATFRYGSKKSEKKGCDQGSVAKVDSVSLFPHQKLIKDYIQFASPYRGILLYHGLGVGKSCASISAAELLMNHMDVVVLLPAALRGNYMNEVKKCGRRFYGLRQHWEFVPIAVFENEKAEIASKARLSLELIQKHQGIWVPVNEKGVHPNYGSLSSTFQSQIQDQINNIIETRYHFINHNGLKTDNILKMTKNGNPFDNKCVVVDEVHNLISRIVNRGKIGTALYKLLMSAKNCKLILLSGTPIINYPYEVAYLINLIIGPRSQYILSLLKNSEVDPDKLKSVVESVPYIDACAFDVNTMRIKLMILPSGFKYSNRSKLEVVRTEEKDVDDILRMVTDALKGNGFNVGKKYTTKEYKVLPEDEQEFNKYFVNMEEAKVINPRLLSRRVLGAVSYYSTYSKELYPETEIAVSNEPMTDFQFSVYEQSRMLERKKESSSKYNKGKSDGNIFKETGQVYRFYSRANCNFVFPDDIKRPLPSMKEITKEIDDEEEAMDMINKAIKADEDAVGGAKAKDTSTIKKKVVKKKTGEGTKDYDTAVANALEKLANHPSNYLHVKNIGKYSPKFQKIIERVADPKFNGSCLVYSQFRRVEGLGILSLALQANGFCEFKIKKTNGEWDVAIDEQDYTKPKYIVFTGNNEETQVLLKIFNSDIENIPQKIRSRLADLSVDGTANNIRGSIIKMLMITQSGAEGISLKNVRHVHVVEPYWNYVRMDQVIGRAVRTCSHVDLPEEDRNVKVFIYNMMFTEDQLAKSFTIRTQDYSKTSDQYIYELAEKKAKIINMLLDTIKNASIDCAVNAREHNQKTQMKCFAFPVNINESELTYTLDMKDETFDDQFNNVVETSEWKGEVLITKKGNFLVRPETQEVYDYDLYLESGKLVRLGVLRIEGAKKMIMKN
jgi:hypothetical protein